MPDPDPRLQPLRRAAASALRRARLNAALARAARLLPAPLLTAAGLIAWARHQGRDAWELGRGGWLIAALGALTVGSVLRAGLRRRPPALGAVLLDRHHRLADRVATALELGARAPAERTPLMEAAISDASARAEELSPRAAVPLRLPRELLLVGAAALACFGAARLHPAPAPTPAVATPAPRLEPLLLPEDDLDAFRERVAALGDQARDPEVAAAVRRYHQLLEDLAAQRIDRSEAFRRLTALRQELERGARPEPAEHEAALRAIASELSRSRAAASIGEALNEQRLADAEQALRALAERLRRREAPPKKAELDLLRASLERASRVVGERTAAATAARDRADGERRRLLKRRDEGHASEAERQALSKQERQLERLERERERLERVERELSRLDRELAEAAAALLRELGEAAQHLERAAEDLHRQAEQQLSDAQKEQLKRQIEELRELLRQQRQARPEQQERLERFRERARGQQRGQPGRGSGTGDPEGSAQARGEEGAGPPGQRQAPAGEGQGAPRARQPGELRLQRGGSGARLPGGEGTAQAGSRPAAGERPGEPGAGGEQWGQGHDPNVAGERTELAGRTRDVSAAGVDTGEGTASSQVIQAAAERGFRGQGYRKVYTDYRHVAEAVMHQDEIPAGYRFYVQRYFQLIRPRE